MSTYRNDLPQRSAATFLTDGGLETTLIFDDGLDLPDFAAFTLLDDEEGRAALQRYFEAYVAIAVRDGTGIVLETPTWRASPDWAARQGISLADLERLNRAAVDQLLEVRERFETPDTPIVISGNIGPRGDGYHPDSLMTADEAEAYHAFQVSVFADTPADLVTALTMTYPEEAIGIVRAAQAAGMPVVISFTVETDGRLPAGGTLADAITAVDAATSGGPVYYMVNCAHPTHFADVLEAGAPWAARLGGLRSNASRMSHAELDEAEELDAGDPADLAARYADLRRDFPNLVVVGGCCGTSDRHIDAISAACALG